MAKRTGRARTNQRRPAKQQASGFAGSLADGIRWDRVGRFALLVLLLGVSYLYLGPVHSYIGTWKEAKVHRQNVAELKAEHQRLVEQRSRLNSTRELEIQARKLGMLRSGERPYAIQGLKP